MPLYVAWTVDRLKRPPLKQGTNWVLLGLGALLCAALIFVFWQTSKDDKRANAFRRNLRRKPNASKEDTASPREAPATDPATPSTTTAEPSSGEPRTTDSAPDAPPQD
jgi:hypothetical protein